MNPIIKLRELKKEDFRIFFDFQTDHDSNYMAAFVSKDPNDWDAFRDKWENILSQEENIVKVILYNDGVAGYVSKYNLFDQTNIGYWIGREFWGKGIATQALKEFLLEFNERPLFARTAFDNIASIRILEKCGFRRIGKDLFYSNARLKDITEYIYELSI